jgi:hypothetical protein
MIGGMTGLWIGGVTGLWNWREKVMLHLSSRKSQCDLLAWSVGCLGVGYVRDHLANLSYLSTCHISKEGKLHSKLLVADTT